MQNKNHDFSSVMQKINLAYYVIRGALDITNALQDVSSIIQKAILRQLITTKLGFLEVALNRL